MGYDITYLEYHRLKDKKYFLDANVWIFMIDPPPTGEGEMYENFFLKLKKFEKKIVFPLQLFSEVINRYLRICCTDFYFSTHDSKNKDEKNDQKFYKHKYRKSEQFLEDFERIENNFTRLIKYYEIVSDHHIRETYFPSIDKLFAYPKVDVDFSDYYYYLLAKNNNYVLVTHDSDFFLEDVEIVTLLWKMVRKAKGH